jgi:antitoxin component YwqK of YwqJK toxin-antitoxin module
MNKTKIGLAAALLILTYFLFLIIYKGINHRIKYGKRELKTPSGPTINGRKSGEWKTYYKNGAIAIIENYINDTLNGPKLYFYPSGKIEGKYSYKKGIEIDSAKHYFENGNLNFEEYRDKSGILNGEFKIYFENGNLSQLGNYKNSKFHGIEKIFSEEGSLKTVILFKDGKQIDSVGKANLHDTTRFIQSQF